MSATALSTSPRPPTSGNVSATRPPRLAVVLYGKVGTAQKRSGQHPAALAQPSLVALAILSLQRHVVEPARKQFSVDTFVHSWSPEVGGVIDTLLDVTSSSHEPDQSADLEARCNAANFSFVPGTCGRTWSQMLGVERAIALKVQHEAHAGWRYDLVYLGRIDLLWRRSLADLLGQAMLRRERQILLPEQCGVARAPTEQRATRSWKAARCDGDAGPTTTNQAAVDCVGASGRHPNSRACERDLTLQGRLEFLLDWWLIADSRSADRFAAKAARLEEISAVVQRSLVQPRIHDSLNGTTASKPLIFGHFFWGHVAAVHFSPGAVRWSGLVTGIDLLLARAYDSDPPCHPAAGTAMSTPSFFASQPKLIDIVPQGSMWRNSCFGNSYGFYCSSSAGECKRTALGLQAQDRRETHVKFMDSSHDACGHWWVHTLTQTQQAMCAQALSKLWHMAVLDGRNLTATRL